MTLDEIKLANKSDSESSTITGWAAWFEGEEGWGSPDDDD